MEIRVYGRVRRVTDDMLYDACALYAGYLRHAPKIYNTYCFSTVTIVTRTRLYVYTSIACLVEVFIKGAIEDSDLT